MFGRPGQIQTQHKKDKNSALFKHSLKTNHQIDYENFEIIDKANNDLKLIKRCYTKEKKINP